MVQPILELNTEANDILLEIFESSHSDLFELHLVYDVCPHDFLKYFHDFILFQKDIFFDDNSSNPLRPQPSAADPGYNIGYKGIIEYTNLAQSALNRAMCDQSADIDALKLAKENLRYAFMCFLGIIREYPIEINCFYMATLTLVQHQLRLLVQEIDPTIAAIPADTTASLVAVHALKISLRIQDLQSFPSVIATADTAADINCIDATEAKRSGLSIRPLGPNDPGVRDGSSNQMSIIGVISEPMPPLFKNSKKEDLTFVINHVFVIRNLVHKFILGAPFLYQHGLLVDLTRHRILCLPRGTETIQHIFPAKLTHSESVAVNALSVTEDSNSLPSNTTMNIPMIQRDILQAARRKPRCDFSLYNYELKPGDRCRVPLYFDKDKRGNSETSVFIPDPLLNHNYGLYSSQGIVNKDHPMIIISNETVHPIHISVDMKLGSVVPYIRITDDFIIAETPVPPVPSEMGDSNDSSYSTLTSAGTTACAPINHPVQLEPPPAYIEIPPVPIPPDPQHECNEILPDPAYSMLGHIPGTFSIDMSPTATTDPASALLPEVDKSLPEIWQQRFHDLSKEFYKIFIKDFSGDPWSQGLHEVHLQPNAVPYASRAFRLPKTHLDLMKEAVDKWLTEGVVKPSDSPWGAPAFVVPKPHNDGLRMVVDYRKLNSMTIPDVWPLPLPETLFAQLHGAEIFSMFDAHSGFTQQSLHPNSQKLTAFVTPFGLFEFTRLSMGLRNGPSSFSRAMYFMTRDLEDMLVYIDDVNIYSKRPDPASSDEVLYRRHFDSVRQFFERCLETNLRLNGKKCGLGAPSIRFLGHIISKDGIHPDPEKVAAVASMQPCTTQTEVRAFLGLVGYYRSFIPMMAKLQIPLNKLLLKGTTFDWTPECQSSFEQLKASLTNECLRRFPNPNEPFELHTDASGYAIGGVLMQRNSEGQLQPI